MEIGRSSRVHDSAATTRRGGNAEHGQSQQDGSRKAGEVSLTGQPCAPRANPPALRSKPCSQRACEARAGCQLLLLSLRWRFI